MFKRKGLRRLEYMVRVKGNDPAIQVCGDKRKSAKRTTLSALDGPSRGTIFFGTPNKRRRVNKSQIPYMSCYESDFCIPANITSFVKWQSATQYEEKKKFMNLLITCSGPLDIPQCFR